MQKMRPRLDPGDPVSIPDRIFPTYPKRRGRVGQSITADFVRPKTPPISSPLRNQLDRSLDSRCYSLCVRGLSRARKILADRGEGAAYLVLSAIHARLYEGTMEDAGLIRPSTP